MVVKRDFSKPPVNDADRKSWLDDCIEASQEAGIVDNDDDAEEYCMSLLGASLTDTDKKKLTIRKARVSENITDNLEFILSDESVDRYGDILRSDGWILRHFKKNPVALFNHNPDNPIGNWRDVRVVDKELRAFLDLGAEGTTSMIDDVRRLIKAKIVRASSVGFLPMAHEPRDPEDIWGGRIYTKQELVEASLVSVPANPNALQVAKALNVSDAAMRLVFGEQANKKTSLVVVRKIGEQAVVKHNRKSNTMSLSQRIQEGEQVLVRLRDQLTQHLADVDDNNVTDEDLLVQKELNDKIKLKERSLAQLRESEAVIASTVAANDEDNPNGRQLPVLHRAADRHQAAPAVHTGPRPFNVQSKKLTAIDFMVRAGTIKAMSKILDKSVDETRMQLYGNDEATRIATQLLTTKAAVAPAQTGVVGWAAELVQQINADVLQPLATSTVFPRLSAMGLSLSFGRNGKISIPTRSATPTIAGSFVGEGLPIPVRQGAYTSVVLTPKKMAVITMWTREMDEHSTPAIEGLLREAIQVDTGFSIDAVLLDSNPATAVRPPGLRNGVSTLTPTAGGGFNALVGDIKLLTGALLTGTGGNVRNPVYLMNPVQANSIALVQAPSAIGVFPFAAEIDSNRLRGAPVIVAGSVPAGTVFYMDAADFVTVGGETPRFEISDQATIHEEDTTPLPITAPGSPATVAAPVRSLWQTDSMALRMILPMNWTMRRTGMVHYITGVTW